MIFTRWTGTDGHNILIANQRANIVLRYCNEYNLFNLCLLLPTALFLVIVYVCCCIIYLTINIVTLLCFLHCTNMIILCRVLFSITQQFNITSKYTLQSSNICYQNIVYHYALGITWPLNHKMCIRLWTLF